MRRLYFLSKYPLEVTSLLLFFLFSIRLLYMTLNPLEEGSLVPENKNYIRGSILSSDNKILALSVPVFSAYIDPSLVNLSEIESYTSFLEFLNITKSQQAKYLLSKKRFLWLKRDIKEKEYLFMVDKKWDKLSGVRFIQDYQREYPYHKVASQIIGFTGRDHKGLAGIEYSMDDVLSAPMSPSANPLENVVEGSDIQLTISIYIQDYITKLLENYAKNYPVDSISALVLDAKTADILSMISYPTFDNNEYQKYPAESYKNMSISSVDEPGSTFKPFVLAHLFDKKIIDENSSFMTKGKEIINGFPLRDAANYGVVNPETIITKSSNIGIVKASMPLSLEDLYQFLKHLDLGEKTGIELPGDEKGIIRPASKMTPRSKIAIPIGQEIGVTALQLASNFTAFANQGYKLTPHIIKSIRSEGKTIYTRPIQKKAIFQPESVEHLRDYMRKNIISGTGKLAFLENVWIAGKSGTAQIFNLKTKQYDKLNPNFIALLENKNHSFVIFVVIRNPRIEESVAFGGTQAAPLVRDIAKFLNYYYKE